MTETTQNEYQLIEERNKAIDEMEGMVRVGIYDMTLRDDGYASICLNTVGANKLHYITYTGFKGQWEAVVESSFKVGAQSLDEILMMAIKKGVEYVVERANIIATTA